MIRPDARQIRRIVEELRYLTGEDRAAKRLEMLEELATAIDLGDVPGVLDAAEADVEAGEISGLLVHYGR